MRWPRILAIAGVITTLAAIATVLLSGGSHSYRVHARFLDAGQLVEGDLVEVGGVTVGSVERIGVSADGQADLTLKITDEGFTPLHAGTVAAIRAVGAAGVANRYVALTPGPATRAELHDGATLPSTATRGIVDLDILLDSLDPTTRARLVGIFSNGETAFASPDSANRAFQLLNPALSQASVLMNELGHDRRALGDLVASSARTMRALDTRRSDLGPMVDDLAASLRTIADNRGALAGILTRTAGVLQRTRISMTGLRRTLPMVGAMLASARPAAAPLVRVLRGLDPAARALAPALAQLRLLLPAARTTFAALPGLARSSTPGFRAAARAIRGITPIVRGLRPYTPDFMSDAEWVGGSLGSLYDATGHYGRIAPLAGPQILSGLGSILPVHLPDSLPALAPRSGELARCPGGAAEPAGDGSNPWVADTSTCNSGHDQR